MITAYWECGNCRCWAGPGTGTETDVCPCGEPRRIFEEEGPDWLPTGSYAEEPATRLLFPTEEEMMGAGLVEGPNYRDFPPGRDCFPEDLEDELRYH